jgi:hypothetical protein
MNLHFAVILVTALPAAALAQQELAAPAAPPADGRSAPEMDGHVFQPSILVASPFRSTTFKVGIAYGVGKATATRYDSGGNAVGTNEYSFAEFLQTFRYEYRFLEWLSAGPVVVTSLYSGVDGPSVVSVGAEVGLGAGVGVKAGYRFGPVQTALLVEAGYFPEYSLVVGAALSEAVKNGVIDPGSALQVSHALSVNPQVAASWAPLPALGLTANVGYMFKSLHPSSGENRNQNGFQFGGLLDFDFGRISSVPIGVLAGYKLIAPIGTENQDGVSRVESVSAGITYTARQRLSLGLELTRSFFSIRPPFDASGNQAQLGLQYYW